MRTMMVGDIAIRERIVQDESTHTIYFHNIKESDMKGLIYNRLYYNDRKELILQFGSDAYGKNGQLAPPAELFLKALDKTR